MTDNEYKEKMMNLERVKKISSKLFQKTGRIAYYGAVCGARELQREYYNEKNGNTLEK